MSTYTGRKTEAVTITRLGEGSCTTSSGWSVAVKPEVVEKLTVGKLVTVETKNFTRVVGWYIDGSWVWRQSDEDLATEHQGFLEQIAKQRRKKLDENREDWQRRTDALPDWVRVRVEAFREAAGEKFELNGWDYELVISELAVMYYDSRLEENEAIKQFWSQQGCSGNQVDMARALARARIEEPEFSLAGTVSALSPITGSADYT